MDWKKALKDYDGLRQIMWEILSSEANVFSKRTTIRKTFKLWLGAPRIFMDNLTIERLIQIFVLEGYDWWLVKNNANKTGNTRNILQGCQIEVCLKVLDDVVFDLAMGDLRMIEDNEALPESERSVYGSIGESFDWSHTRMGVKFWSKLDNAPNINLERMEA